MHANDTLPVDLVLPDLKSAAWRIGMSAVLVAPPGAGKTTRVPAALLGEPLARHGKILVLEPRRIAARAAAEHMARRLGERLGDTVGLRTRLATAVGPATRIEFVTEGIFTRLILDDPALAGIGAVIFDEFHERSIDADFGLALALDARAAHSGRTCASWSCRRRSTPAPSPRSSATLRSSNRKAARSPSRPATSGATPDRRRAPDDRAILDGVARGDGFDPRFPARDKPKSGALPPTLEQSMTQPDVTIVALCTAGSIRSCSRMPSPRLPRASARSCSRPRWPRHLSPSKAFASSSIAACSGFPATIPTPRSRASKPFASAAPPPTNGAAAPDAPSRASAIVFGRRPRPKACCPSRRLKSARPIWPGLVLDCAAWGETDVRRLAWLDPPPQSSLQAARDAAAGHRRDSTLRAGSPQIGRRMRALPMPPRLARMVLLAADQGSARQAAELAALLVKATSAGPTRISTCALRISGGTARTAPTRMRRMADRWASDARKGVGHEGAAARRGHVDRVPACARLSRSASPRPAATAAATSLPTAAQPSSMRPIRSHDRPI